MWQLAFRRIAIGFLLIWVVSLLIFAITQVLPGDAAEIRLGQDATPESLAALRKEMGLDQPAYVQYMLWLERLLSGDLGVSVAGGATI
ncbi:MAG: ABC transporter permease, partial [Kiloniellales bacterium]|nr:ABC transporter permease [Kiloniellales bacterium]